MYGATEQGLPAQAVHVGVSPLLTLILFAAVGIIVLTIVTVGSSSTRNSFPKPVPEKSFPLNVDRRTVTILLSESMKRPPPPPLLSTLLLDIMEFVIVATLFCIARPPPP